MKVSASLALRLCPAYHQFNLQRRRKACRHNFHRFAQPSLLLTIFCSPGLATKPSKHRLDLRRGAGSAGESSPTTAGLGTAGFFFPLLKLVLGMGGSPSIRQQGGYNNGCLRLFWSRCVCWLRTISLWRRIGSLSLSRVVSLGWRRIGLPW